MPTVQSRALKIKLALLNEKQFQDLGLSKNEFMICLGNLEKRQAGGVDAALFETCKTAIKTLSSSEKLLHVSRVLLDKKNIEQIIENFNIIFSKMIEEKLKKDGVFKDIFPLYSFEAMARILEKIDEAKQKIKFNCNQQAVLDCLLLAVVEERVKWAKKN